jgi:hypothetical protein
MRVPPINKVAWCLIGIFFFAAPDIASSDTRPKRIKGTGKTISLKQFQKSSGLSNAEMKLRFGAAARISCPFGFATAFLIEQPDVFITSDHLFVVPEKKAKERGSTSRCTFRFFYSNKRYSIKADTLIHGLRTSKSAYNFEWFDWAIGRLNQPVKDVQPFVSAGTSAVREGVKITMISAGMNDLVSRVCNGEVSSSLGNTSINAFTTTCDTGPGASGGPVLLTSGNGPEGTTRTAVGMTWGYNLPYWKVSAGVTHLAFPLSDDEIQKALRKIQQQP